MDFKLEIQNMRNCFEHHRNDQIRVHRPWWMFADEELSTLYSDKTTLLQQGKVYYACLLQANTKLFQKFPPFDYPAQIVFSTSPVMDENPYVLMDVVDKLYSYKYSDKAPPTEWIEIVENIRDEKDRTSFSFSCCSHGTEFVAKMQTIMIFRKHLPTGILKSGILPVIACPEVCGSALVLPSEYWSGEFTEVWQKDKVIS